MFCATQEELRMCNLLTLKTTIPEVETAIQESWHQRNVFIFKLLLLFKVPFGVYYLILSYVGDDDSNLQFKTINTLTTCFFVIVTIIISLTRLKKLVYYLQFFPFIFNQTMILVYISGIIPNFELN